MLISFSRSHMYIPDHISISRSFNSLRGPRSNLRFDTKGKHQLKRTYLANNLYTSTHVEYVLKAARLIVKVGL